MSHMHASEPGGAYPAVPAGAIAGIGAAPVGQPVEGVDPATGGPATIKVTRIYDSASGHACREYVVWRGSIDARQGLACDAGGTWQEVAPLIPSLRSTSVAGLAQ